MRILQPHHIEPLSTHWAMLTEARYCCSQCWADLQRYPGPGQSWFVLCPRCLEDTPGFVTKAYRERRKSESISDLWEAREVLRAPLALPEPIKRSPDTILKELGF